jgi:hypothetical protein
LLTLPTWRVSLGWTRRITTPRPCPHVSCDIRSLRQSPPPAARPSALERRNDFLAELLDGAHHLVIRNGLRLHNQHDLIYPNGFVHLAGLDARPIGRPGVTAPRTAGALACLLCSEPMHKRRSLPCSRGHGGVSLQPLPASPLWSPRSSPTTRGLRPPRVRRRGAARGPTGGVAWPVSHPPHTPSVPRDRDR